MDKRWGENVDGIAKYWERVGEEARKRWGRIEKRLRKGKEIVGE